MNIEKKSKIDRVQMNSHSNIFVCEEKLAYDQALNDSR
ncbi:hypothetical protein SAMN05216326_10333 [Nitrosomonas marina]|uniref:Uncharacterized protein n=1 Tax=Nitrosomonas marina TaxID=917 RepID=A0A1H9Z0P5_9PROT|nr:hypothetical protein SAMN05216326_10333 [Nitrosomonas marina]